MYYATKPSQGRRRWEMEAIEIDKIIEDFAKNIAEEVATKRFYEVEEVKAIATTRLTFALTEILKQQVLSQEDKRAELRAIFNDPKTPAWKQRKVMAELTLLNTEIKKVNKAVSARREYDEYQKLRYFVRQKLGQDALNEFYTGLRPEKEDKQ
jgi:hypothetical protein